MDQCTENYECLVINNNAKSNRLDDQVFWYKAEPHCDFKLGAEILWQQASRMTCDSDEDDDEGNAKFMQDYNNSHSKKKKLSQFQVKKTS
jgi:hypothetical protein